MSVLRHCATTGAPSESYAREHFSFRAFSRAKAVGLGERQGSARFDRAGGRARAR